MSPAGCPFIGIKLKSVLANQAPAKLLNPGKIIFPLHRTKPDRTNAILSTRTRSVSSTLVVFHNRMYVGLFIFLMLYVFLIWSSGRVIYPAQRDSLAPMLAYVDSSYALDFALCVRLSSTTTCIVNSMPGLQLYEYNCLMLYLVILRSATSSCMILNGNL